MDSNDDFYSNTQSISIYVYDLYDKKVHIIIQSIYMSIMSDFFKNINNGGDYEDEKINALYKSFIIHSNDTTFEQFLRIYKQVPSFCRLNHVFDELESDISTNIDIRLYIKQYRRNDKIDSILS